MALDCAKINDNYKKRIEHITSKKDDSAKDKDYQNLFDKYLLVE